MEIGSADNKHQLDLLNYLPIVKIILIICGFLLLYFFLVKPILTLLKKEIEQYAQNYVDPEKDSGQERHEIEQEVDMAVSLVKEVMVNPAPTAHIVKQWIQET